jgi:predicted amidohydrolase
MNSKIFKLALCQVKTTKDKLQTYTNCRKLLEEAKTNGAQVCVLGETWNMVYVKEQLHEAAENLKDLDKSPTYKFMSDISKELQFIWWAVVFQKLTTIKITTTPA